MIEAVEELLVAWGKRVMEACYGGGLPSPAGTLVEWLGGAPRTASGGSRILLGGAGPDFMTSEVEAALEAVARAEGGEVLRRLARLRYTFEPALSVAHQVADLDLGRGDAGLKAYTRAVHRLHEEVRAQLLARHGVRQAETGKARREGDRVRKLATKRAPDARARAAGERFRMSRSSGDSAS